MYVVNSQSMKIVIFQHFTRFINIILNYPANNLPLVKYHSYAHYQKLLIGSCFFLRSTAPMSFSWIAQLFSEDLSKSYPWMQTRNLEFYTALIGPGETLSGVVLWPRMWSWCTGRLSFRSKLKMWGFQPPAVVLSPRCRNLLGRC